MLGEQGTDRQCGEKWRAAQHALGQARISPVPLQPLAGMRAVHKTVVAKGTLSLSASVFCSTTQPALVLSGAESR